MSTYEREKRNAEIVAMRRDGKLLSEIASNFGMTSKNVSHICKAMMGVPERKKIAVCNHQREAFRRNKHKFPEYGCGVKVCGTWKETAIAYYGRASAADIAKSTGKTRNSIIGYWHRNRHLIEANGGTQ